MRVLIENAESSEMMINLQHCSFDSPLAKEIGQKLNLKIGTAKHVSMKANIPMDWDLVYDLINDKKQSLPKDSSPSDTWSPELDLALEPCHKSAEYAGYLMTPILIVDGNVVHSGDVPSQVKVFFWLQHATA